MSEFHNSINKSTTREVGLTVRINNYRAIKAYKKYKQENQWFSDKLQVITTKTGHAAINKACELLDLKLVYVDLNKDYTMDVEDLKQKKDPIISLHAPKSFRKQEEREDRL